MIIGPFPLGYALPSSFSDNDISLNFDSFLVLTVGRVNNQTNLGLMQITVDLNSFKSLIFNFV